MTATRVGRRGDMGETEALVLTRQDDGDIIVSVGSGPRLIDAPTVEFCTGPGGGRSPRVMAAIRALWHAIEDDNRENPSLAYVPPAGGERCPSCGRSDVENCQREADCPLSGIPTPPEVATDLPPGWEWRQTEDDMELSLVAEGRRLGGINVWTCQKSGEVAWWTAVRAVEGAEDVEVRGFHDTVEGAQMALLLAIREAGAEAASETAPAKLCRKPRTKK